MGNFTAKDAKKSDHNTNCRSIVNSCDARVIQLVVPVSNRIKRIPNNMTRDPISVYMKKK